MLPSQHLQRFKKSNQNITQLQIHLIFFIYAKSETELLEFIQISLEWFSLEEFSVCLVYTKKLHVLEQKGIILHTDNHFAIDSIPTSCSKSTLSTHNNCLFSSKSTVTHSPPESFHTDLHSALTLPLSTHKTKISRATLCLGGGVPLTDNTDYWGITIAA